MRKQVAILAGGLGTRLRPITEKVPKPLVPVCGEPFLHWQIADLREQGYTDFVLLVSYLGELIEAQFGDGSRLGVTIEYAFEQSPMGTGGAVLNAANLLEDEFVLLNGDSFLQLPLDDLAGFFDEGRFDAVLATYGNQPPTPVPNNLKVKNQMVLEYEKAGGIERGYEFVDAGVYVLKKSLFTAPAVSAVIATGRFQLEDVLKPLIEHRRCGAFEVGNRFFDIGTPERLAEFEQYVSRERQNGRLSGCSPEGMP